MNRARSKVFESNVKNHCAFFVSSWTLFSTVIPFVCDFCVLAFWNYSGRLAGCSYHSEKIAEKIVVLMIT